MVSASNADMKSFAAGALANLAIKHRRLDEPHPSSPTPNRFLSAMADLEGRAHRRQGAKLRYMPCNDAAQRQSGLAGLPAVPD